jgi:alpha-beta hydrolase superfamily lysophospholipase
MASAARFVWLHGFGSSPASSKAAYVAARLRERGVPLEVPDLNQPSFFELTLGRMLGQVDSLAGQRPEPLALIGSSLGGYAAALWAQANPTRVAAVALLAPALDLAARWSQRMGSQALAQWRAQGRYEFDHYARRRKEPLSARFLDDAQARPAFPLPRAPTLIVQGLRDDVVAPALARELVRRLREARVPSRLVELDEGHELTADLPGLWRELQAHFAAWLPA